MQDHLEPGQNGGDLLELFFITLKKQDFEIGLPPFKLFQKAWNRFRDRVEFYRRIFDLLRNARRRYGRNPNLGNTIAVSREGNRLSARKIIGSVSLQIAAQHERRLRFVVDLVVQSETSQRIEQWQVAFIGADSRGRIIQFLQGLHGRDVLQQLLRPAFLRNVTQVHGHDRPTSFFFQLLNDVIPAFQAAVLDRRTAAGLQIAVLLSGKEQDKERFAILRPIVEETRRGLIVLPRAGFRTTSEAEKYEAGGNCKL